MFAVECVSRSIFKIGQYLNAVGGLVFGPECSETLLYCCTFRSHSDLYTLTYIPSPPGDKVMRLLPAHLLLLMLTWPSKRRSNSFLFASLGRDNVPLLDSTIIDLQLGCLTYLETGPNLLLR